MIQEGKNFLEIAKQYSDSPSIGTIERGQLLPTVEEAVFNLTEDQTSSPMEIETGIYIFKLNRKIPSEIASLKEIKEDIYNLIFQQKFKDRLEAWIGKLKKHAYIEIKK